MGADPAETPRPHATASPILRTAAELAVAGAVFGLWQHLPPANALEAWLVGLGLDQGRAGVLVALAGAALAGAGATSVWARALAGWAAGCAWYCLLFVLPQALHPSLALLPGESVNPAALAAAALALAAMGFLPAGLGAAAGWGLRLGLGHVAALPGRRPAGWAAAGAVVLLAAISGYGLSRTAGVLTYGPWDGVAQLADPPPAAAGQRALSPLRVITFSYQSTVFGGRRQADVILPAGYYTAPLKRYPVIYVLHGDPGSMGQWQDEGVAAIVARLSAAGRMPPAVIVNPDGNGPRGASDDHWADEYVPGDLMESDLIDQLIPAVDSRFRVLADAGHRAVMGLSSGGYGAVNLALRHPGLFALAVDASGDLVPEPAAFRATPELRPENSPLLLALRPAPPGAPAIFVGWANDGYTAMNKLLARRLAAHGYRVFSAGAAQGHSWQSFRLLFWDALTRFGNLLGPTEPLAAPA